MPSKKQTSKANPFRDEVTTRRRRLMMWGRFPAFLIGGVAMYFADAFWPGLVVLGLWYAIWFVWVGGVFDQ